MTCENSMKFKFLSPYVLTFIGTLPLTCDCLWLLFLSLTWYSWVFATETVYSPQGLRYLGPLQRKFAHLSFNAFYALLKCRRLKKRWWSKGKHEIPFSSVSWLQVMPRKCLRCLRSCLPLNHDAYTAQCPVPGIYISHSCFVYAKFSYGEMFNISQEEIICCESKWSDCACRGVGNLGVSPALLEMSHRTSGTSFNLPTSLSKCWGWLVNKPDNL